MVSPKATSTTIQYNASSLTARNNDVFSRLKGINPITVYRFLIVGVFIVICLLGMTTSSLGKNLVDPSAGPAQQIGTSQSIRSDEFLRGTPWQLGILETGNTSFASPLAYPNVSFVLPQINNPIDFVIQLQFAPLYLGSILPEAMLFAFVWWLPLLVLLLALPEWLKRLGVRYRYAIPAAMLVALSPSVAWWSGSPIRQAMAPLIAALALHIATEAFINGKKVRATLFSLIGGVAIATAPLFYTPWGIMFLLMITLPTVVALVINNRKKIANLAPMVLSGMFGAVILLIFLKSSDQLQIAAQTVYPGTRRTGPEFIGLDRSLNAPLLWFLPDQPGFLSTGNKSEMSSSYLVLGLVTLLLVPLIKWTKALLAKPAFLTVAAVTVIFGIWISVSLPQLAGFTFPLNLIPPKRIHGVIGIAAIIAFFMAVSAISDSGRAGLKKAALPAGLLVAFITLLVGSNLVAHKAQGLTSSLVVLTAVIAGAVVSYFLYASPNWYASIPLLVAAFFVVAQANPLISGFGEIRSSQSAQAVRQLSAEIGPTTLWATDSFYFDALLMANGVPSITGQQIIGPNKAEWQKLDPSDQYPNAWNRGASYITASWDEPKARLKITSKGDDIIEISTSPCDKLLKTSGVGMVVSQKRLVSNCLADKGLLTWGGTKFHIYRTR